MADYLDRLSRFVSETHLEDLDHAAVSAAKTVVLDTIGAIVAGSRLPENRNLAELATRTGGGGGPSTVIGHSKSAPPVFAALVNATAGVALEMDEGSRLGGGHPSIHVVPAAMAIAEEVGARGRRFLESVIVGYETTSRIGSGTKVRRQVHSHGTWGTVGSAAAVAKLLDFGPEQTKEALNIACSMSPANTWTPCLEGATVRNLYPGRSGLQGIMAAQVSLCGFTGVKDGPADIYSEVLGRKLRSGPGDRRPGRGGSVADPAELLQAPRLLPLQPSGVGCRGKIGQPGGDRRGERGGHPGGSAACGRHHDRPGAAQHAGRQVLPALRRGRRRSPSQHGYHRFLSGAGTRPGDQISMARRVEIVADPEMDLRRYDYPAARVSISLRDGQTLNESVTVHHGDYQDPASRQELEGKFTFLVQDILGPARTSQVIETVQRLDALEDIRELTALLRSD